MTGQDPVAWLRKAVEERLAAARLVTAPCDDDCARPCGFHPAAAAEWHEMTSGVLETAEGTARKDPWAGVWAMGDSRVTRFIAANDPRDTIARCEAELAILDRYEKQDAKASENAMEEDRAWTLWPVVALLASGYRYWPGYEEEAWQ